eukprot:356496-Chlamydomonas_euryale.AAC.7
MTQAAKSATQPKEPRSQKCDRAKRGSLEHTLEQAPVWWPTRTCRITKGATETLVCAMHARACMHACARMQLSKGCDASTLSGAELLGTFARAHEHRCAQKMLSQRRKLPPLLNERALFTRASPYGDKSDPFYHSPSNRIGSNYSPARCGCVCVCMRAVVWAGVDACAWGEVEGRGCWQEGFQRMGHVS